jgi:DNA-binding NarL/FixJ family response regulator
MIRVYLADDHELVRYALRSLLDCEPDIEIVGEAADGDAAVEHVAELTPDVLVLDMRMPGPGGVEVCRRVKDRSPDTRVLILTSFDDDEEVFGALSVGAAGYLLKGSRADNVAHAVRSVAEGQAVLEDSVAQRVIAGRGNGANGNGLANGSVLSDRELEVLGLMAKGYSNKEIGRELWIGETTVKTHVSHILRKLEQGDRTQAVLHAVKLGLVSVGGE